MSFPAHGITSELVSQSSVSLLQWPVKLCLWNTDLILSFSCRITSPDFFLTHGMKSKFPNEAFGSCQSFHLHLLYSFPGNLIFFHTFSAIWLWCALVWFSLCLSWLKFMEFLGSIFFIKFGKCLVIIFFQIPTPSLLFSWDSNYRYVRPIVQQVTEALLMLFSLFVLQFILSSSSLIFFFFSVMSNLLFSLSSEIFISYTTCMSQDSPQKQNQ